MGNFLKALANKQVTELKILTENHSKNDIHVVSFRNFLTGHILKRDGFIGITGNNELNGNSSILANTIQNQSKLQHLQIYARLNEKDGLALADGLKNGNLCQLESLELSAIFLGEMTVNSFAKFFER